MSNKVWCLFQDSGVYGKFLMQIFYHKEDAEEAMRYQQQNSIHRQYYSFFVEQREIK